MLYKIHFAKSTSMLDAFRIITPWLTLHVQEHINGQSHGYQSCDTTRLPLKQCTFGRLPLSETLQVTWCCWLKWMWRIDRLHCRKGMLLGDRHLNREQLLQMQTCEYVEKKEKETNVRGERRSEWIWLLAAVKWKEIFNCMDRLCSPNFIRNKQSPPKTSARPLYKQIQACSFNPWLVVMYLFILYFIVIILVYICTWDRSWVPPTAKMHNAMWSSATPLLIWLLIMQQAIYLDSISFNLSWLCNNNDEYHLVCTNNTRDLHSQVPMASTWCIWCLMLFVCPYRDMDVLLSQQTWSYIVYCWS